MEYMSVLVWSPLNLLPSPRKTLLEIFSMPTHTGVHREWAWDQQHAVIDWETSEA